MADNYLERRMQDLRDGIISSSLKPKKRKSMNSVLIAGRLNSVATIVREYRNKGWRTAFICPERKEAAKLSQLIGARYYPCDILNDESIEKAREDVIRHWGGLDKFENIQS